MKITRIQLRQIIKEAVALRESVPGTEVADQTFGSSAPHPLLRDSYSGNGWITSIFMGAPYDFAKANAAQSEHMQLLVDILDGKVKLDYIPFIFADELMMEFSKLGLDPRATQELDQDMVGEDNEYDPPGW